MAMTNVMDANVSSETYHFFNVMDVNVSSRTFRCDGCQWWAGQIFADIQLFSCGPAKLQRPLRSQHNIHKECEMPLSNYEMPVAIVRVLNRSKAQCTKCLFEL